MNIESSVNIFAPCIPRAKQVAMEFNCCKHYKSVQFGHETLWNRFLGFQLWWHHRASEYSLVMIHCIACQTGGGKNVKFIVNIIE